MKLIHNWKDAWKMRSVQTFAAIGLGALGWNELQEVGSAFWHALPADQQAQWLSMLPSNIGSLLVAAGAAYGAFARIQKQRNI